MVTELLSEQMQEDGQILLAALDKTDLSVKCCYWLFFPDIQQWRFVLSISQLDVMGPLKVYKKIQNVLRKQTIKIESISLENIAAVGTKHPLGSFLSSAIKVVGINRMRLSRSNINGVYVEDAYIYRT